VKRYNREAKIEQISVISNFLASYNIWL
jgi:hypothetical protein